MTRLQAMAMFLSMSALASLGSAAHAEIIVKYEYSSPSYLPSSQGWSASLGAVTLVNNTTDNALTVSDASTDNGASISSPGYAPSVYSGGWILTAVVRADSSSNIADIYFAAAMNPNFWNIWVSGSGDNTIYTVDSNHPGLIRTMATVPTSQTAFHTYQLYGNGSNPPELWIDGVATGQFAGDGAGSSGNNLVFGNWTSTGTSESNWKLLQLEVPEPASAALLSLGGLLLLRKRR